MIEDVIAETSMRCRRAGVAASRTCARAGEPLVGFSPALAEADRAIKGFLYPRLYRHPRIMQIMGEAEGVIADLFERYLAHPADLPAEWRAGLDPAGGTALALRIADFIAGMTDRYAMVEHERLFGRATAD